MFNKLVSKATQLASDVSDSATDLARAAKEDLQKSTNSVLDSAIQQVLYAHNVKVIKKLLLLGLTISDISVAFSMTHEEISKISALDD